MSPSLNYTQLAFEARRTPKAPSVGPAGDRLAGRDGDPGDVEALAERLDDPGAEARRRQADAGDVRHGDGSEIGRRGDRKGASAVERTRVATREYVPDGDLIGRQFGDQRLVSVVKSRHRLDSCNVG